MFMHMCLFLQIGEKEFCFVLCLLACLSPYLHTCLCAFIAYLCMFHVSYSLHIYVYLIMHELRGSFFEAQLSSMHI